MKNLLLSDKERLLFRYQRSKYLEGEEDSETPSETDLGPLKSCKKWEFDSAGDPKQRIVDKLVNWRVEKPLEKKLLFGILHRKGY